VPMIFGGATASIQIIKGGKLKGIGITSKSRLKVMPELPSISETFPGYDITAWYGFMGPAGMPREVVNKIHADVVAIVKRPEFQERLVRDGIEPIANTPDEFAAQIKTDLANWAGVVKASGAKLD